MLRFCSEQPNAVHFLTLQVEFCSGCGKFKIPIRCRRGDVTRQLWKAACGQGQVSAISLQVAFLAAVSADETTVGAGGASQC